MLGLPLLVIFSVLLALNVPISFALGGASVLTLWLFVTWMVEKQGMAAQSPERRALILEYLVQHFGQP